MNPELAEDFLYRWWGGRRINKQGILFRRRLFTRVDLDLGICTIPLKYRQDFELSNMRRRPYSLSSATTNLHSIVAMVQQD
jgi:hypothetical protein